jgi:dolichol-phosphate mannosyltransferase
MKKLSIIIPTFNEAPNIKRLVFLLQKNLKGIDYEVLFVDDSTDETPRLIEKYSKEARINYKIIKGKRQGLGNAILLGLKNARAENVCIMDADLQHPPSKIKEMIHWLKEYDLVIASRFVKGSRVNFPLYRKLFSLFAISLMHLFIEKTRGIKDPSSGFFCLKRKKINRKIFKIKQRGFKILLDLLVNCNFEKIKEIPFEFGKRERGKSKLGKKELFSFFEQIFRYGKQEMVKFVKFLLVGLSGVFVNELLLWLLTEKLHLFYAFSGAISVEASIIWNFTLNYLFTFKAKNKFFKRLLKDNLVRIGGLIVNLLILIMLAEMGLHYLLANLFGIAAATIFNFLLNVFWVFRK